MLQSVRLTKRDVLRQNKERPAEQKPVEDPLVTTARWQLLQTEPSVPDPGNSKGDSLWHVPPAGSGLDSQTLLWPPRNHKVKPSQLIITKMKGCSGNLKYPIHGTYRRPELRSKCVSWLQQSALKKALLSEGWVRWMDFTAENAQAAKCCGYRQWLLVASDTCVTQCFLLIKSQHNFVARLFVLCFRQSLVCWVRNNMPCSIFQEINYLREFIKNYRIMMLHFNIGLLYFHWLCWLLKLVSWHRTSGIKCVRNLAGQDEYSQQAGAKLGLESGPWCKLG